MHTAHGRARCSSNTSALRVSACGQLMRLSRKLCGLRVPSRRVSLARSGAPRMEATTVAALDRAAAAIKAADAIVFTSGAGLGSTSLQLLM